LVCSFFTFLNLGKHKQTPNYHETTMFTMYLYNGIQKSETNFTIKILQIFFNTYIQQECIKSVK